MKSAITGTYIYICIYIYIRVHHFNITVKVNLLKFTCITCVLNVSINIVSKSYYNAGWTFFFPFSFSFPFFPPSIFETVISTRAFFLPIDTKRANV